jgi:hypothetical protein
VVEGDIVALAVARSTAFAGARSIVNQTSTAAPTSNNAATAASTAFAGRACFAPDIVTEENHQFGGACRRTRRKASTSKPSINQERWPDCVD